VASSVIVSITLFARKHLILHNKPKIHVQPRSSALNVTLPAFAAERRAARLLLMSAPAAGTRRRQLSIDFPAAELPAANPPATAAAADRWDRQTDRFIGPAPPTQAVLICVRFTWSGWLGSRVVSVLNSDAIQIAAAVLGSR